MSNKFNILDIYKDIYKDLDDPDENDDLLDNPTYDDLVESLPKQPSTKLADVVISFRYLGLHKELSIASMEELAKRRITGDTFQFEKYIEDNLQSLPKLDFKLPNLDNILKNFGNMKK